MVQPSELRRTLRRASRAAWLGLIVAAVFVACGGPTATPGATPAPAQTTPGATSARATVIVENIAFGTNELSASVGSTVTWENRDAVPHTVTHGTGGTAADSARFNEPLPANGQVELTFDEAGSFAVTCTIHPQMQMTVSVNE